VYCGNSHGVGGVYDVSKTTSKLTNKLKTGVHDINNAVYAETIDSLTFSDVSGALHSWHMTYEKGLGILGLEV
jgi:hypothetical protein